MTYRAVLIFIIFVGILLVTIELVKSSYKCPKEQVIYRYIPKTLDDENAEPVYVTDIFKTMFSLPSPWVIGVTDIDRRKQEQINKYFISQS